MNVRQLLVSLLATGIDQEAEVKIKVGNIDAAEIESVEPAVLNDGDEKEEMGVIITAG